jgi:hypothetical protein
VSGNLPIPTSAEPAEELADDVMVMVRERIAKGAERYSPFASLHLWDLCDFGQQANAAAANGRS